MRVTKVNPKNEENNCPLPRCGHKMVYLNSKIYLFGGNTFLPEEQNGSELWSFHTINLKWNLENKLRENFSNYGFGYSMVIYQNQIFTFSGKIGMVSEPFIHCYDFENWKILETKNETFPRFCHSSIVFENKMYIFGGKAGENFENLNDTIYFDFDLKTWFTIEVKDDFKPEPRYFHSSIVFENFMYIYGGFDGSCFFSNIHKLNLKTNQWTKIEKKKIEPIKRRSHSSSLFNSKMYIFGGILFLFNQYITGFDGYEFLNDLWCFDLKQENWKEINIEFPPEKRRFHSVCTFENGFYIFGGFKENRSNLLGDLIKFESTERSFESILFRNGNYFDCIIQFDNIFVN
eukprot:gene10369-2898_t